MHTPTFCPELTHHAFSYAVPMVVEQTSRGERGYDIISLLLKNRIVFEGTLNDDTVANLIVAQLLYLAHDPDHEIQVYINTPRWCAGRRLAIYDTMHLVEPSELAADDASFSVTPRPFRHPAGGRDARCASAEHALCPADWLSAWTADRRTRATHRGRRRQPGRPCH